MKVGAPYRARRINLRMPLRLSASTANLFAAVAQWPSDAPGRDCLTHARKMVAGLPLGPAAAPIQNELWLGMVTCADAVVEANPQCFFPDARDDWLNWRKSTGPAGPLCSWRCQAQQH